MMPQKKMCYIIQLITPLKKLQQLSLEILMGEGSQMPNFLKESMKQNWNFQMSGAHQYIDGLLQMSKPNNFPWEGHGYKFLREQHILMVVIFRF